MEKVVKRALGYGKPKDNENFTHVIFTEDEYTKKERKISGLEDNIRKLEREYNAAIERYKRSADSKIAEIRAKADERISEVQAEMNTYKSRADSFENANRNLIRVATERANAKRGLTPKKAHSGYIFLNIDEYIHNCECYVSANSKKTTLLKLPCFRIRLQSPYETSFDLQAVKDLIYGDLLEKIMNKMNVNSVYKKGIFGYTEEEVLKIWKSNENFIFKIAYKANFQKSFWEIELLTHDMPAIPPDMFGIR